MFNFFKKKIIRQPIQDPKVDAYKQAVSRHAGTAHKSAKKLNELLEANGITLRIYIATGGKHHGRL